MTQISRIADEYKAIRKEYAYNADIMSEDSFIVARLKNIIENRLSLVDRTIILLYIDCLSYRKLGEKMHLSHTTIRKEVLRIKNIILHELNNEDIH